GLPCNISQISELESLDNYHVQSLKEAYVNTGQLNCTHYNKKNLTYTLRSNRNGVIEELESFECSDNNTFHYQVKGESAPRNYTGDCAIFCAMPINRTCTNPFDTCKFECPEYTAGSDGEVARLR
ncbi:hypothetical protein PENTCL1PPCAC_12802, partial [Pristionchus entomophagus]